MKRFIILKKIGNGSVCNVLLAFDGKKNILVALKLFKK